MAEAKTCGKCGAPVEASAAFGQCPQCLLQLGFAPVTKGLTELAPSETNVRSFGDYEILDQIGRGGMGVVFRARQKSLNRIVALKKVRDEVSASPVARSRFHQEARAAAKLDHPNIVSTHEFGEIDGQPFFTMRLIEGKNLAKRMPELALTSLAGSNAGAQTSKGSLHEAQKRLAGLMATIAHAIHYAHQEGVIHRDLKPSNILMDDHGRPYLTDFGIAKILSEESGLTDPTSVLGTLNYMAPEQAAGKTATRSADIYSLGVIFYELLTGRPPFRADTPLETLRRVTEEEPTHPTALNRQADRDLATICLKCLEKDPMRRYSTAEAMAEDLERWLRNEPIHARRADPILRVKRWVRRNPAGAGLIAVLCVTLAVVLGLLGWVYREQQSKRETVQVLQNDVISKLAELWTNSLKESVTIDSATLAALRGDRQDPSPSPTSSLGRTTFAVYTHQEPEKMLSIMSPVLGSLEKSVARSPSRFVRIDLRIYRRYDKALEALERGEVGFMRIGSSSYIEAKAANPLISLLAKQNGQIRGYIFAHPSANIRSNALADLRGKSIAFVEDSSTTGNYLSKLEMVRAGLTASDLRGGSTNYLGSHDTVVKAVAAHRFDAGAGNASVADKFLEKADNTGKLKIIRVFRESMGLPWVASPTLAPALAASIRTGLLAIQDQGILANLGNGTSRFLEANDADYNSLREAMREAADFDRVHLKQPGPR